MSRVGEPWPKGGPWGGGTRQASKTSQGAGAPGQGTVGADGCAAWTLTWGDGRDHAAPEEGRGHQARVGLLEVSGWRLSQPCPEEEWGAEAQRGQGSHPNRGICGGGSEAGCSSRGAGKPSPPPPPRPPGAAAPHATPQEPVGPSALAATPAELPAHLLTSARPPTPQQDPCLPLPTASVTPPGRRLAGRGRPGLMRAPASGAERQRKGEEGPVGREGRHRPEGAALSLLQLQEPPRRRVRQSRPPGSRGRWLVALSPGRLGPRLHSSTACPEASYYVTRASVSPSAKRC